MNTPLFACWLLLFGVLPIDRHTLMLERAYPGVGFDELEFEPRLAVMRAPLRWFVGRLFRHRHAVLLRRFSSG